jgi:hypothetical protein
MTTYAIVFETTRSATITVEANSPSEALERANNQAKHLPVVDAEDRYAKYPVTGGSSWMPMKIGVADDAEHPRKYRVIHQVHRSLRYLDSKNLL